MYASYYLTQQEYSDYVQSLSVAPVYSVRPQLFIRYGRLKEPLRVTLNDLLTDTETTTSDKATSTTSVTLLNPDGFSVNDFILLGQYGNEESEVVRITALTGNVATISAQRTHPTGTKISRLAYNQIEISNSPSIGGAKTILGTVALQADGDTLYTPTILGGYYYARYYNSFSLNYSDYSDALPYLGFNKNMARAVIDNALLGINKEINEVLTDEYAFVELNNCLEEVQKAAKRYSFYQQLRVPTRAEYGRFSYDLPPNIDNLQTLMLEYDRQLVYKDLRDFSTFLPHHTAVTEPVGIGAGVVKVVNGDDFPMRVNFVPTAPTVTTVGLTGTTQYTYALEINTARGWSRMAGTQIVNGYDTIDYLNYNKVTWDEQPNATEYRLYRTEGSTLGLLYSGPYIAQFLDTGKSALAPIEQQQPIGNIYISGVALPYIENIDNIFTLQYPSPVAANVGADVTTLNVVGDPIYYTMTTDNRFMVYPASDTARNYYLTYYSTNTYINQDQDVLPFDNTMIAVYYLQWKFLTRQNNGVETEDSLAKKSMYEKQLYLLRTKDNNGATKLKPIIRSWSN